ncbi:MAG TPA: carboxypeptidase regulatory-like domain-containing protein [Pirellulales bacterium]|jgi:hypothetical protein|nr:carboxypeptidase regulatory-like domain-containing protein [Pirellulales bacterium]
MKRFRLFRYVATGIAGFGLVLPTGAMAAQPDATPTAASEAPGPSIIDVTLGQGGTLRGQVVDAQGVPMALTTVTVRAAGTEVASAVTDAQGNFSIVGVHGGVIEADAAGGSSMLRVWTANASPPSANKSVLLVADGPVARGQSSIGPSIQLPIAKIGPSLPGSPIGPPSPIVCQPIIVQPVICQPVKCQPIICQPVVCKPIICQPPICPPIICQPICPRSCS